MIPQYVTARLATCVIAGQKIKGILVSVLDENYQPMDWTMEENVDAARISASNFRDQYRVPIAEITERLLNI